MNTSAITWAFHAVMNGKAHAYNANNLALCGFRTRPYHEHYTEDEAGHIDESLKCRRCLAKKEAR